MRQTIHYRTDGASAGGVVTPEERAQALFPDVVIEGRPGMYLANVDHYFLVGETEEEVRAQYEKIIAEQCAPIAAAIRATIEEDRAQRLDESRDAAIEYGLREP